MIREVVMYQVVCDEPGCGYKTGDDWEYSAWADAGQAVDDWLNAEHQATADGKQYCSKHRRLECCVCDKTEGLVEFDGDTYCTEHLEEETASKSEKAEEYRV